LVLAASHGRGLFTTEYDLDIYTGEEEHDFELDEIAVYPNPASDFLTIRISENNSIPSQLNLTDLSGRSVLKEQLVFNGNKEIRLDISGIKKGIYILNLKTGKETKSQKLVIQ
jgi:hypothetical protein